MNVAADVIGHTKTPTVITEPSLAIIRLLQLPSLPEPAYRDKLAGSLRDCVFVAWTHAGRAGTDHPGQSDDGSSTPTLWLHQIHRTLPEAES